MKLKLLSLSLIFSAGLMSAQTYQVPVTEDDEPMMQGQFRPTWESLSSYQVPEWFRNAKILPHGRRFGNNIARQTAEPDFSDIQDTKMKKEGKFPLLFHFCILNIGKIRFSGLSGNVISKPSAVRENFRIAEPFGYLIGRQ